MAVSGVVVQSPVRVPCAGYLCCYSRRSLLPLLSGWRFDKAAWDASVARHNKYNMAEIFKCFDSDNKGKLDIYTLARGFRALGLGKRDGTKMEYASWAQTNLVWQIRATVGSRAHFMGSILVLAAWTRRCSSRSTRYCVGLNMRFAPCDSLTADFV